jgi:hypothetical protein
MTDLFDVYNMGASGANDTIFWLVIGILVLFILGSLIFLIFYLLSFKHKFRVIDLTNGVERVLDDKCKLVTSKTDGVQVLKLLKMKKNAQFPPSEAISLTSKGHYSFEARYTEETGFCYILARDKQAQISSDRLTTNQKIFLSSEFTKANLDKKTSIASIVERAVPYIALIIIVVSLFIFWGDIVAPFAESRRDAVAMEQIQLEQLELLRDIKFNIQSPQEEGVPN